jgi:uncharacterized membrane protein
MEGWNTTPILLNIIAIILIIVCLFLKKFNSDNIYIISLIVIGLSLILIPQLKSSYVIGVDSHHELSIFNYVSVSHEWDASKTGNLVNAAISIAILAPMVSNITNLSGEFILKYILSIYSIGMLPVLFLLIKKILNIDSKIAFLLTLIPATTGSFMLLSAYGRQEVAMFSTLICIYFIFFKNNPKSIYKSAVLILISISIILSHYSTGILLFIVLLFCFIIYKFNFQTSKLIGNNFVWLYFVFLLTWLIIIVKSTSSGVIVSFINIISGLDTYNSEKSSIVVKQQLNPVFFSDNELLNYYFNVMLISLMFIGMAIKLYDVFKKKKGITIENAYYIFSSIWLGLLLLSFLPNVSTTFNIERTYTFVIIFSVMFIYVSINTMEYFIKSLLNFTRMYNLHLIALFLIVITHLMLQSGALSQVIYKTSDSKYFNNPEDDLHYTLAGEVSSINWIDKYSKSNYIYTDFYGRGFLTLESHSKFDRSKIIILTKSQNIKNGLFYELKSELKKKITIWQQNLEDILEIETMLKSKSKIYTSKYSNVYI